jgi:hypothetical protein
MWGQIAAKLDQPVGRDNWTDDDAEEFDLIRRAAFSTTSAMTGNEPWAPVPMIKRDVSSVTLRAATRPGLTLVRSGRLGRACRRDLADG